jgi:hypothetical protein
MEDPKVIIERRLLYDAGGNSGVQRIALVYVGTREYRVYAPSRASGDPVQWKSQLTVNIPIGYGELPMPEPDRSRMIEAVFSELERSQTEAAKAQADTLYCEAQILHERRRPKLRRNAIRSVRALH